MRILINGIEIGDDCPTYFIAEIGSNFDGSINRAKQLATLALDSGAQAVKFQHYTAQTLVNEQGFRLQEGGDTHQSEWQESVFKTYEKASLNSEWTAEIANHCEKIGITFFTSPYSVDLVDYVDQYVPAFKIGSGDITYDQLIVQVSEKGKPVLLATGASEIGEVDRAVQLISERNGELVLMQCNTNYQAKPEDAQYQNVRALLDFKERYPNVILGLSDHTRGHLAAVGAVALGARVIEKHFTDDIGREGPDHGFAMDPSSFQAMVSEVRTLECMLGDGVKRVEANEADCRVVQRRGVCTTRILRAGECLSEGDLTCLRPCPEGAFPPYELPTLVGRCLTRDAGEGEILKRHHFE